MIRYRKTIGVKTTRNGDLYLDTDLGQTWKTIQSNGQTAISDWLWQSAQTEQCHWQKDMAKVVLDAFVHELKDQTPYTIYHVYQRGQGYQSRQSDVFLMRIPSHNAWFLSTSDHTWIFEESLENFHINIETAIGSIMDREVRQQLYDWSDQRRGIPIKKIKYTDSDYAAKGLI
jgi:hypothetical protein